MPSIIIGGENTNVGLRYMDELARQRELAMREASMRQSISMASSSRSGGGGGMESGVGGARMVQAPEASPQPSQMGENGLPVDAEERTRFMRQMFAGQQNQAKAQQMQQLDANSKQYDQHLAQFGQALQHAQTPEQVEQLMGSIRDVTKQKQDAVNQLRGLQSTPNKTGNQQLDALAAILGNSARGGGQAKADVDSAPYEAMGKFYAQGAQEKVREKQAIVEDKQRFEQEKRDELKRQKDVNNAEQRIQRAQQAIQQRITLTSSGKLSEAALAEIGDGRDLTSELQIAQQEYDALSGAKSTIDGSKDAMAAIDAAGQAGLDAGRAKLEADKFDQELKLAKLGEVKNVNTANKLKTQEDVRLKIAAEVAKMPPEGVAAVVEAAAQRYKQTFGVDMGQEEKRALMSSNPTWANTQQYVDEANSTGDWASAAKNLAEQYTKLQEMTIVPGTEGKGPDGSGVPIKKGVLLAQMGKYNYAYLENELKRIANEYAQNAMKGVPPAMLGRSPTGDFGTHSDGQAPATPPKGWRRELPDPNANQFTSRDIRQPQSYTGDWTKEQQEDYRADTSSDPSVRWGLDYRRSMQPIPGTPGGNKTSPELSQADKEKYARRIELARPWKGTQTEKDKRDLEPYAPSSKYRTGENDLSNKRREYIQKQPR